eukprot:gene9931-biopygen2108
MGMKSIPSSLQSGRGAPVRSALREISHTETTADGEVERGGVAQSPAGEEDVGGAAALGAARAANPRLLPILLEIPEEGPGPKQASLLLFGGEAGGIAKMMEYVTQLIVAQGPVAAAAAGYSVVPVDVHHPSAVGAVAHRAVNGDAEPALQHHDEARRRDLVPECGGAHGARDMRLWLIRVPRECGVDLAALAGARGARREVRGGGVGDGGAEAEARVPRAERRLHPLLVARVEPGEALEALADAVVEGGEGGGVMVVRGHPHAVHHLPVGGAAAEEEQGDLRIRQVPDRVEPLLRRRDARGGVRVARRGVAHRGAEQLEIPPGQDLHPSGEDGEIHGGTGPGRGDQLAFRHIQLQTDTGGRRHKDGESAGHGTEIPRNTAIIQVTEEKVQRGAGLRRGRGRRRGCSRRGCRCGMARRIRGQGCVWHQLMGGGSLPGSERPEHSGIGLRLTHTKAAPIATGRDRDRQMEPLGGRERRHRGRRRRGTHPDAARIRERRAAGGVAPYKDPARTWRNRPSRGTEDASY